MNNVDFQYIYDYFFDPGKVKGRPYKPLRSPSFSEATVVGKLSEAATKNAAESWSGVLRGLLVVGRGQEAAQLAKHAGQHRRLERRHRGEGTGWALGVDGRLTADAEELKRPVPGDFEVSYNVVAAQNYRWGAKSLTFKLSNTAGGRVILRVRFVPVSTAGKARSTIKGQFPGAPGLLERNEVGGRAGIFEQCGEQPCDRDAQEEGGPAAGARRPDESRRVRKGIPPGLQFDAMSFDLWQPAVQRMTGCSSAISGLPGTNPGETPLTIGGLKIERVLSDCRLRIG